MVKFLRKDVAASFDSRSFDRGRNYQHNGRVEQLRVDKNAGVIEAEVYGTEDDPYEVSVSVKRGRYGGIAVSGSCSCPVGDHCKHMVAALLEYLELGENAAQIVRGSFDAPVSQPTAVGETAQVEAWLREVEKAASARVGGVAECVLFIVDPHAAHALPIVPCAARRMLNGAYGKTRPLRLDVVANGGDSCVRPADAFIGALLQLLGNNGLMTAGSAPIFDSLLDRLAETERFHLAGAHTSPLRRGDSRPGSLTWRLGNDECQYPLIESSVPGTQVLRGPLPWYVDAVSGEAGLLAVDADPALIAALNRAPMLRPSHVKRVRETLERRVPASLALPVEISVRVINDPPTPVLRLSTREPSFGGAGALDQAEVCFDYGGGQVSPFSSVPEITEIEGGSIVRRRRNLIVEDAAVASLQKHGLRRMQSFAEKDEVFASFGFEEKGADPWLRFAHLGVSRLREAGWRVEVEATFRHSVIEPIDDAAWDAEFVESSAGWFDCEVGIQVEGARISLLPILLDMLRRDRASFEGFLRADSPETHLYLKTPQGMLALPFARLRTIIETFLEVLDPKDNGKGVPPLSLLDAAGLENAGALSWKTPKRLAELTRKLASFAGVDPIPPPAYLRAQLRPYQQEGLHWLQFLREYGFGGILADDMGLGKTIQTLAHVLTEKESGRMKNPVLLVVPTSIVPNWLDESARFAPTLKTLSLHGADRAMRFRKVKRSDLVITTYPLLCRDELFVERKWHAVILDEAQMVKNPLSKGAQLVRRLRTEHRLCLTGTPIENHLGELWTQFDFLMPGTLGDHRRFTRFFRTPIEKEGDARRRDSLSRRVRPFILRRTKDEVAKDLPPKTEMIRRVELAGDQRDLYEAIRLAMHDRVRREVSERGLARSRIVILDALLKLRQACCDPRLVKIPRARKVKNSAKLSDLREMLPQLLEDGRRVLIFSQFTSMLDLVEPELERLNVPFVQIRGTTKDRRTPVERFQAGEVPVFLISLKAGGTGLNLTSADTVIHLDPWWNPAVERQATDRAHRMGQTKSVFVYKIIAAGTVEERILEMQARKAAIADGLFQDDPDAKFTIEAEDLERLFAPIERGAVDG